MDQPVDVGLLRGRLVERSHHVAEAMVVHARRNEYKDLPVNVIRLLLALFVAIGRF
ncbi:hypothetical protein [Kibdelosporangium aridum]|uniref:hypothetical protein n=1 Tax=Kibdelosporangium aridum TaxID=2030 RepID=UPI001F1665B3|nr:hypothetical protein [Kibdelosporangium aridum]